MAHKITYEELTDSETKEKINVIVYNFDNIESAKEILKDFGLKRKDITGKALLIKNSLGNILFRFLER